MADFQISLSIDNVMDALIAFLRPFVGQTEIVRAQVNRVAMPHGAFVLLTEMHSYDLETPWYQDGVLSSPRMFDVQIDFYGELSGEWCSAVQMAYRSMYGPTAFPPTIQPLYCSDGMQGPLITAEEQYANRWTLTATLQYNPIVTMPQQSATQLAVNLLEDIQ